MVIKQTLAWWWEGESTICGATTSSTDMNHGQITSIPCHWNLHHGYITPRKSIESIDDHPPFRHTDLQQGWFPMPKAQKNILGPGLPAYQKKKLSSGDHFITNIPPGLKSHNLTCKISSPLSVLCLCFSILRVEKLVQFLSEFARNHSVDILLVSACVRHCLSTLLQKCHCSLFTEIVAADVFPAPLPGTNVVIQFLVEASFFFRWPQRTEWPFWPKTRRRQCPQCEYLHVVHALWTSQRIDLYCDSKQRHTRYVKKLIHAYIYIYANNSIQTLY